MMRTLELSLSGFFILLSFQFKSDVEPFSRVNRYSCGTIGVIWDRNSLYHRC